MTYAPANFKVATPKGLKEDAFTRNVTDRRTDGQTADPLWYENSVPFFLKKNAGIVNLSYCSKCDVLFHFMTEGVHIRHSDCL